MPDNTEPSQVSPSDITDPMYKELRVKFPEEQGSGAIDSATCPNLKDGVGTQTDRNRDTHIVSELLCYMQYKLKTLPIDRLVSLCATFYSKEVIAQQKKLLWDSIKLKDRLHVKRGPESAQEDIKEMAKVFLEVDPNATTPIFVASNLGNLPPLSAENVDVLKLHSDIEKLSLVVSTISEKQRNMYNVLDSLRATKDT